MFGYLILAPDSTAQVVWMELLIFETITVANGVSIKQDKIGDIPCSKLDKFGNHVNYTRLNSVKFGKQNTFNLFSANNAMQHNWMATGNRDNGWCIENEAGDVVKFDIWISTTTSCIGVDISSGLKFLLRKS
jgi:hypothetical protein